MTTLSINNLSVRFGEFEAIKNISLDIKSGEFITLLGPSGCGKTTLLKTLAGFISVSSGKIEQGGLDVTKHMPEKRDTAMCFQSYALFPHLSVAENILFGPKQKKLSKELQAERLSSVAKQMSLETQLDKYPSELSGGQQQRVALGRALAIQPGIMLFDEPLSNLDAKLRDSVRHEIRQLQKKLGFTAIYVTHDQAEALAMSDRVVVMNQGQVQQEGTPEEIYRQPINKFVADFVGGANILKAKVTQTLAENQYLVHTVLGNFVVETEHAPRHSDTYICWRPEDMVVPAGNVNIVKCRVSTKTFLGNLTELALTTDLDPTLMLRAELHGRNVVEEGNLLPFSIAPQSITFLQVAS